MMNLIKTKHQFIHEVLMHVLIPLLIGGLIYLLFRNESLIMFNWFDDLGLLEQIKELRATLKPMKSILPNWIYYSLADGLWTYAFVSAYLIYYKIDYWLILPFVLSIGVEVLQYFQLFQGTFDVLDLLCCIVGYTLPFLLLKNYYQLNFK